MRVKLAKPVIASILPAEDRIKGSCMCANHPFPPSISFYCLDDGSNRGEGVWYMHLAFLNI